MAPRLKLHALLKTLLGSDNVYFQPPPDFIMSYPCIVYSQSNIDTRFANNLPYNLTNQYSLTVIFSDPDSDLPKKVASLPMCKFDRRFVLKNLNHSVFTITY